jgi:CRISPR/Cas system-associated exonuclease Cas4 (RecB family)
MPTLAALRAMPHTSISAIKTYVACPRLYHYRYVEYAQAAWRPLALVFGSAFHTTVGQYLLWSAHGRFVPIEELREHLRDALARGIHADGPPVLFEEEQNEGDVVDQGVTMLDAFVERVSLPEVVHGVEVPFRLDLVHPVTGEVLDVPLIGALDALVEEEGRDAVWELKTAKKKWSSDQIEYDLQGTAYTMAARALGHEAEVELLVTTKATKPDVQRARLVRYARDERELVDVALSVQRAVNAGVDYPIRDWPCKSCPYAGSCGS